MFVSGEPQNRVKEIMLAALTEATSMSRIEKVKDELKNWLMLSRFQTVLVTPVFVWIGYFSVASFGMEDFLALSVAGGCFHIWWCVSNDINDYEYDKEHSDVETHLIAKGTINKTRARVYSTVVAAVGLGTIYYMWPSLYTVLPFVVAVICGEIYNALSKSVWQTDFIAGVMAGALVLLGMGAAGSYTLAGWLLMASCSLHMAIQMITGDLKDLTSPESSFASSCGVKVRKVPEAALAGKIRARLETDTDAIPQLQIADYTKSFVYSLNGMKLLEIGLLAYILMMYTTGTALLDYLIVGTSASLVVASILFLNNQLVLVYDREKVLKNIVGHELASVALTTMVLAQVNIVGGLVALSVPFMSYAILNPIVHSGSIIPQV